MHRVLILSVLLLLPGTVPSQDQDRKDDLSVQPIKVIEIKRTDKLVFEKDIYPIIKSKCITCHSGIIKDGKFDISSYENIVKGGKRGSAITPGKKETSLLYKLAGRSSKPHMPPPKEENQKPLSPEELALIGLWLDQGAITSGIPIGRPEVVLNTLPTGVQPVRAVAISPDKSLVVSSRGNQIHIYGAANGEFIRSLFHDELKVAGKPVKAAHVSLVNSLAFSPDGKYLVSGSFAEISIWDVQTGELVKKIKGFAHDIVALAFSPDGSFLATGGGVPAEDGEISFFNTENWIAVGQIKGGHSDVVYGLSFSPTSMELLVDKKEKKQFGLMIATCSADKSVKTWEVPSGKYVKAFDGHTHHVLDVSWTRDGRLLASVGGDNSIKVWDFVNGTQVRTIAGAHDKQVLRTMFIGKTIEVLTCGGDGLVKIFNTATNVKGGAPKTFAGGSSDYLYALSVSADGTVVAAGGQDGLVYVYNGTNTKLIRTLLPPDAQPPMKIEEKK